MLTRRVIPCLDVARGVVVKGVRFADLRVVGEPVGLARRYAAEGADELCLLDVEASPAGCGLDAALVARVARVLRIPFTVGGGIGSRDAARALLRAGADKVALNSAALARPALLDELAAEFGRQCVVLSIDARLDGTRWCVTRHGGRRRLAREALDWAREGVERGAGEVLLNVIDADGTRAGFALEPTRAFAAALPVPVIASGGAHGADDFRRLFQETEAAAGLAASLFHDRSTTPRALKAELLAAGIEVRA